MDDIVCRSNIKKSTKWFFAQDTCDPNTRDGATSKSVKKHEPVGEPYFLAFQKSSNIPSVWILVAKLIDFQIQNNGRKSTFIYLFTNDYVYTG